MIKDPDELPDGRDEGEECLYSLRDHSPVTSYLTTSFWVDDHGPCFIKKKVTQKLLSSLLHKTYTHVLNAIFFPSFESKDTFTCLIFIPETVSSGLQEKLTPVTIPFISLYQPLPFHSVP